MIVTDFIKKNLKSGDKVKVTFSAAKTVTCYFGGYKTWEGVSPDLSCLFPVLYGIGKKGQMVQRRAEGLSSTVYCMHDISNIKKIK